MEHAEYEARRRSFGAVADDYDRWRPGYPEALVDDVIALARGADESGLAEAALPPPSQVRAVEAGAGTGKATQLFAARGVQVVAIEPSSEMAALARRRCEGLAAVKVVESSFEDWQPEAPSADLVFSAQAWHWVQPDRGYAVARAVLRTGGVFAAFWNRPAWERCALREPLDDAYERHAPELVLGSPMRPLPMPGGEADRWYAEIADVPGFAEPEVRRYPWPSRYRTEEYVALLRTHSDHGRLAPERLEALLGAVAGVIDAHGGVLELQQATRLCLARAV